MAKAPVGEGPFRPGTGGLPPCLAGREEEQDFFRTRVRAMADGVPPPNEVILYGPRGNGKTALLVWLQREIARANGVEAIRLTPSEIPTGAELAERLLSETWWAGLTPEDVSVAGITWRPGRGRQVPPARDILAARARKKPLVLLLDEAHTLAPEVGQALLNASQIVGRDLPFLLVLAGTPNLQSQLAQMSASFWSRAHPISVNRLGDEPSAEAICKPLEEEGLAVASDALEWILGQSHGYPFFLQLWGSLVWRRATASGKAFTRADADEVLPDFERRQGFYYLERFNELAERDLLESARAVADAFEERPTLHHGELRELVSGGADALRELRHLGFIWQSGTEPGWEPGIPSLMQYIRKHAPQT